jgi:hypothetical protein
MERRGPNSASARIKAHCAIDANREGLLTNHEAAVSRSDYQAYDIPPMICRIFN